MTFEWPVVAAIGTLGGFGLSFATFWYTFGSRMTKAEANAEAAKEAAISAKADAATLAAVAKAESDRINERLILLGTSFSLYREQVAKDYVSRDIMREMEERITSVLNGLGGRMDRLVENFGKNSAK